MRIRNNTLLQEAYEAGYYRALNEFQNVIFDPAGSDDSQRDSHIPSSPGFLRDRLPISTPDGRVWVLDNSGKYVPYAGDVALW